MRTTKMENTSPILCIGGLHFIHNRPNQFYPSIQKLYKLFDIRRHRSQVMKKEKKARENGWEIITNLCVIDVKKLYQIVCNQKKKKVTSEKLSVVDVMLFTFPSF